MKPTKFLIVLTCCFLNFQWAIAQTDINIGKTYTISSEILDQNRDIHIYLPEDYDDSEKDYPVLFILDGQWFFTNGVAIQKSLRVPGRLPEMIIVGIENANPLRRTLFWDEREKFLSFLEDEVFTFLDTSFRASDDRIIFGWESSAYFACYALFNEKQLFNAAIVTNGAYESEETLDSFSSLNLPKNKYLFMTNSDKDIYSIGSSEEFSQLLTEKSPNNLTWKYEKFNDEIHESLAHIALYHGLNYYFHNFQSLVFGSIQEYKDLGGMEYMEAYHKKRGERYGFPTEVDNSAKDGLIWLAWNRDDFASFKLFMTEFEEVLSTPRYASAYWQNRFAQFYLMHNDSEKAIEYFNTGIATYPDAPQMAEMHHGLGKAHLKNENRKLALRNFKKAVEIAEKDSDPQLDSYKAQLAEMKK